MDKELTWLGPRSIAVVQIDRSCHVCAFFNSREEEYTLMLPFLKEGLGAKERCFQIIDPEQRDERLRVLSEAGVDLASVQQEGMLEVRPWQNAYLAGGRFDQNAMISLIQNIAEDGEKTSGVKRLWANMEWALQDFPGVHDIVEYESRLNYVLPRYDMATVCTYALSQFSATVVMDILRTRPQVIIGGALRENPFYAPPDAFLQELRSRSASTH